MKNKPQISLFLGAGASMDAGLKSVDEITIQLLNYIPNINDVLNGIESNKIKKINFLNYINTCLDELKSENKKINYEDILNVILQIESFLSNRNSNYLIKKSIDLIIEEYIIKNFSDSNKEPIETLKDLCEKSKNFIIDYLKELLSTKRANDFNYLSIIKQINDLSKNNINIFTLNFDTLVEDYFANNNINYSDGFINKDNIKLFQSEDFEKSSDIKIIKLHGSINYFIIVYNEIQDGRISAGYIKAEQSSQFMLNNNKVSSTKPPILLCGSENKLLEYNNSLYIDQIFYFQKYLFETDILIVIGYSFGDIGINLRIINWLVRNEKNKMIIMSPCKEELINNSQFIINNYFNNFKLNRIQFIEKRFKEVIIEDIENAILLLNENN